MKALAQLKHLSPPVATPNRLRVVVKEAGSPPLTGGDADAYDETVVIAQMKGEAPELFAERAVERLAALGRSHKSLSAATLQTGTRHDRTTNGARRTILGALLDRSHLGGNISEVLLEATSSGADDHYQVMCLVDDLLRLPSDRALPVRLRFREVSAPVADADSGVFWVPPATPGR